ncbi:hypothetical protein FisN_27Lh079 [Fistulifera solaris]|uniref:DUF1990 domain-containing protein n=1 Tax=Fistulifera solaris TaxID=1519565 RepID=A0A1Z5JQT0_FISSO|nr:hypothetical protein FisN_27Lh079 [Fistulifera solaris]|eukprot:GAX16367.1 hypothetical protein FisN_27Lh079 [Fistulifera solaris]
MTIRLLLRAIFGLLFTIAQGNQMVLPTTPRHKFSRSLLRQWRQRRITTRRRLSSKQQQQQSPSLSPMLSFRRPTTQSLLQQLGHRIPLSSKFNHPTVGMTHPYLQTDLKTSVVASRSDSSSSSSSSDDDDDDDDDKEWWPPVLASPHHWRILRYRQTVGHGWECYTQVRDAALQWDFATLHQGICTLVSSPSSHDSTLLPRRRAEIFDPLPAASSSVHQISHGPGRRLVTYSRIPFLRFLFTINPVQVIYDIVDQREYPVVYSATAYATGDRHFLQGEERVTVAYHERSGAVQVEVLSCSRPHGWKGQCVWPFLTKIQDQFFRQQMEALAAESATGQGVKKSSSL